VSRAKPIVEPKRHHYVPEFLQRRFVNDAGNLYVFNRERPERGVFQTTPKNVFVEKDLYTRFDADGSKDAAVEQAFNSLETFANDLIERFVSSVRVGVAPQLNAAEKSAWDDFFFLQTKRVPEFHDQYVVNYGFEEELDRVIRQYERDVRVLTDDERAQLRDPKEIERLRRNTKLIALTKPGELVRGALAQKGLALAHIQDSRKSFVLGSSPVVKLNHPDRPHLSDDSVEVWLPIASDIAISPSPEVGVVRRIPVTEERHIRSINLAIARQSRIVAARDEALVRSIAFPR
jgi:hypothetical protein